MKILFDPIYTNDPQFCSMAYKMQQATKYLIENTDNVFVTFLVPDQDIGGRWETDYNWFFDHERVQYELLPSSDDRMKEYYRYSDVLRRKTAFYGEHWDHDMIVTARIPMVATMKANATAVRANRPYAKQVVTVEDMPILNFKKCVAQTQPAVQDLQHIAGYAASDANWFMSYWERDAMLKVAKEWLSPSSVQALAKKSFDTSPIQSAPPTPKTPALVQSTANREKPFTVGYTQRFENIHRRTSDIFKIFEKQWIFHSGKHKMRFVSTSNSAGGYGTGDTQFLEFLRPPREEFWRMMKEEVDVIIVMSIDDAYPLSLLEPLLHGTPVVLLDAPYALRTVGSDYPFFIHNEMEAYGMVKAFHDDYAGMYAKFEKWLLGSFGPLMQKRNEDWWPPRLLRQIQALEERQRAGLATANRPNEVIDLLLKTDRPEINIFDDIRSLKKSGEIRHLAELIGREEKTGTSFMVSWNETRLRLKYHHGYDDASVALGHLRRKTA